ncbi:hypothetical protein EJ04DRAFT_558858 [Polyplosphaeria fusca]|uniref:Uncharacterized protein n=1 Tax=Polyplosphaeria fusca TaxID=682080 RepID=A0A9P4R6T0_9PLEO|nr:hypothetical protein EJ04DRAFT_558858 [Polyplosphaeria fusca]
MSAAAIVRVDELHRSLSFLLRASTSVIPDLTRNTSLVYAGRAMKTSYLLACALALLAAAGPAPTDCPRSKCYSATNACNVPYGGCWDECTLSSTQLPTFTIPSCSSVPTATITSPPDAAFLANATATPPPKPCSPLHICEDWLITCGGTKSFFGACFDTCSPSTPPTCTKTPVPAPTWPPNNATTTTKTRRRVEQPACTAAPGKPWMCKPANW